MGARGESETNLETGLTVAEVGARLRAHGYNEIPEKRRNPAARFARKFWGVTPAMLELTVVLTWLLQRSTETVIVFGLLVFNGVLGFAQEERASTAVQALRKRLQITARVKRDRLWMAVPARELVPGDVVRIRGGDLVPADVRIASGAVDADQSALTGESVAVTKAPGDAVYSGSTILRGEATGTVGATGAETYFGRTVELVQIARPKLHMEDVVARVVRWLLAMVGVFLVVGLTVTALRGGDVVQLLPIAVVLLVSAIPVALPTMFAISMALGAVALAREGVLVTRLSAVEDAATMDVLCADKTGTITMNRLSVAEVIPFGNHSRDEVLRYAALASEEANRDPIDIAVLAAARDAGVSLDGIVRLGFVPFEPATRRTATRVKRGDDQFWVWKGAVGAIASMRKPDVSTDSDAVRELERLWPKGHRAIAVAVGPSEPEADFAGLIALADRPRRDAAELIRALRGLGISVKMLTGDALPIARETAREVGLADSIAKFPDLRDRLKEDGIAEMIETAAGLAEIYPEDKYLVVRALQNRGHVTGMTGDGVNDAPALRQAEVGIAVSDATDVAKSASSAVLMTEGLGGIVELVETGRRVYQRIVTWILNKIVKTFQVAVFVVLAFLATGQTTVSVLSMVLFIFVTDFVTLALSTDSVRYSQQPDTWRVHGLVKTALLLGTLIVAESFILLYVGIAWFGLSADPARLHTFIFDYLVFLGVLDVLILRERRHFWESRPSRTLLGFIAADILAVVGFSLVGVPQLPALSPVEILTVLSFSAATSFLINDAVKVALVRRFGART